MVRRRGLFAVLSGALAIALLTGAGGSSEEEIACAGAVSHLSDCCPGFDVSRVDCGSSAGCEVSEPSLSLSESQCIEALDCNGVRAKALCSRVGIVTNAPDATEPDAGSSSGEGGGVPHQSVCP